MIFIGDYFALGLVLILCVFFFDNKISIRHMPKSSMLFVLCLITTALTAVTDLITGQLQVLTNVPLWQNVLWNSLYFVVNIITTSFIALYLFTKILEHTHEQHCMRKACIGLIALFAVYMCFVIANLWNGCLFYFDAAGKYCRGPLNALGYFITMAQLLLVTICYFRNQQNASLPMRRVLAQLIPIIPLCIIIQRSYPEIMLNGFLMALVETVLFLSFQGQREGVHNLTKLNDRHRFFAEISENLEHASAKTHGLKQKYIRCTKEIREEMVRRRYLRERLQTVDRAHGYEVWFQPIQCLSTGAFCSMEALIRLREPDGSLISPAEFIPLAEQTGQIFPITWFVLDEVCQLLKSSPELADVSVSINMPMAQLLENGFIPRFIGTVDQAGIEHRRICIEFTERAILENFQNTHNIMQQLAYEGFRFYLDDFGTGYSNFNCLLQLPFQFIKLDTCLVHSSISGLPDYAMSHMLTNLFHDMNLVVVAEGVEEDKEVKALTEMGIDRIQGFALARPMPEDKLLNFYREHPLQNT